VRLLARRWGLDCRALRARAIGLAATHPEIAAQFVEVVDGAPRHYGAEDLLTGSGARCVWRCGVCGEKWVTSVANRTKRRSGCPTCGRRRQVEVARTRPAKTCPLSETSQELTREFVRNLSRLDRGVDTTPSGSHDRVLWRCRRGHQWETSARQRVKYRSQCPTCLTGLWTSRLEHQVAELVSTATGSAVTVGARLPRVDRAAEERVDLEVAEAGLFVDLDPTRWHSSPEAVARDHRKLERLGGTRYVRIRPRTLGLLDAHGPLAGQQVVLASDAEDDPTVWAAAVCEALRLFSPTARIQPLTPEMQAEALARADLVWRRLRSQARSLSLLSEFPSVAEQFVEVVDRPGLTPADLAPAGDDRVVWRCSACGHTWEARVGNRTVLGTGCPPCSARRGAASGARPAPGQSFADHHPDLVRYFVVDETNPGLGLADLRPNSTDRCRWTCPHCGRHWIAKPQVLHRNPNAGCRACGYRRSARGRSGVPNSPEPGRSFADLEPQLVEQFIENLTHPGIGLEQLKPSSRAVCLWRCPHCGAPWKAPVHARTRHPNGGCRGCASARAQRSGQRREGSAERVDRAGARMAKPPPQHTTGPRCTSSTRAWPSS
jgi:rubrerythrin